MAVSTGQGRREGAREGGRERERVYLLELRAVVHSS